MPAATANQDRKLGTQLALMRRLPAEVSARPYAHTILAVDPTDGYCRPLAAGESFVGFHGSTRPTADDAPESDGDGRFEALAGIVLAILPITGVAQDDVAHMRPVFATDDNTFSMTDTSGSYIGNIIGVHDTDRAVVLCRSADLVDRGPSVLSVRTMAATGAQTLRTADLGKLILVPNTAALTITLPAAADCAGRGFIVKKTTADVAIVTLDGNAAETIDGAATNTAIDAAQDTLTIVSDGTAWHIVASKIA